MADKKRELTRDEIRAKRKAERLKEKARKAEKEG